MLIQVFAIMKNYNFSSHDNGVDDSDMTVKLTETIDSSKDGHKTVFSVMKNTSVGDLLGKNIVVAIRRHDYMIQIFALHVLVLTPSNMGFYLGIDNSLVGFVGHDFRFSPLLPLMSGIGYSWGYHGHSPKRLAEATLAHALGGKSLKLHNKSDERVIRLEKFYSDLKQAEGKVEKDSPFAVSHIRIMEIATGESS
jgi:hypothetical protein